MFYECESHARVDLILVVSGKLYRGREFSTFAETISKHSEMHSTRVREVDAEILIFLNTNLCVSVRDRLREVGMFLNQIVQFFGATLNLVVLVVSMCTCFARFDTRVLLRSDICVRS